MTPCAALRFGVALRGYAMDQVDAVLDRLAAELDARDARIAELEAQLGAAAPVGPSRERGRRRPAPPSGWEQPR